MLLSLNLKDTCKLQIYVEKRQFLFFKLLILEPNFATFI
jgi:hypothetical protein